jgi:hypothetical protein
VERAIDVLQHNAPDAVLLLCGSPCAAAVRKPNAAFDLPQKEFADLAQKEQIVVARADSAATGLWRRSLTAQS